MGHITKEQFSTRIPGYVETARRLTDVIMQSALERPNPNIAMSAWLIMRIGVYTDTEELREMWERRDEDVRPKPEFKADIVAEGFGVALRRSRRNCAIWTYESKDDGAENPQNLITPAFVFDKSDNPNLPYVIKCATYPGILAHRRVPELAQGIDHVITEDYLEAVYPKPRFDDIRTIEQYGVYGLHAAKIDSTLRIVESVARSIA
ncbi:MAG: hypothetical protein ABWX94_01980 [Candidatus Saccharimonadales bacterium]